MNRCLIVDDDKLSRIALERLVLQSGNLTLVKSCSTPVEALEVLRKQQIDILMVDVEMPELSGLELIKSLKRRPEIIIVTAKEHYAVEAFDVEAADYLVKPVTLPRFLKAVNRVLARQKAAEPVAKSIADQGMLYVKVNNQLVSVPIADVLWIEATGDYVTIHTERQNFIAHATMKAMEEKLPAGNFMRVHRSHIVQLQRIKAIEETHIIIGKTLIPIGKSYHEPLMKRLNRI